MEGPRQVPAPHPHWEDHASSCKMLQELLEMDVRYCISTVCLMLQIEVYLLMTWPETNI